jgi:uncharacterized damage-inducible protein DinB
MTSTEVIADAFGRIHEAVHEAVDRLSEEELSFRVDNEANSIAWLVWHLTRVQDDHVAAVAEADQVWTAKGWEVRFGLDLDPGDTGYGHDSDHVATVRADAESLTGYFDAVHAATLRYIATLVDDDLDRVVDTRWDPPVTLGARLVSVIADDLQHAGQAALVRGVAIRR